MMDNIDDFKQAVESNFERIGFNEKNIYERGEDESFCPICQKNMRTSYEILYCDEKSTTIDGHLFLQSGPCFVRGTCVQCKTIKYYLAYFGKAEECLSVISTTNSGFSTEHTPECVKFYLDQAYRSQCNGANSAAMVMYRAALEWILYEQGFHDGMLDKKINDLATALATEKAPKWANDLDPEFLKAIKKIGNGAIHTNSGDISKQASLDNDAVKVMSCVFAEILNLIYERPALQKKQLEQLQKIQQELDTKKEDKI